MSQKITPSPKELLNKTDDELREILSQLNTPSLRKLSREFVNLVLEYKHYSEHLKEENELLFGRLNNIIALAEKEIK